MSTASPAPSPTPTGAVGISLRTSVAAKLADYLELTKPRIAVLVLVSVTVGFVLGSAGNWRVVPLLHALLGIGLVAAGSSALNQFLERRIDAHMDRTAHRPLPAGRILPGEVLLFGLSACVLGSLYLAATVNAVTAVLAMLTLLLYVMIYTPLKRVTALCTAVGAISGAMPPVLGWTAAGGRLEAEAFVLFGILFLWQFPHFLAIAWIYHSEYSRAGLRMLPAYRPSLRMAGFLSVGYVLCLLPVSLLPSRFALAGSSYFLAATVLGIGYLVCAIRFALTESPQTARGLVLSSLLYLPLLLLALTWDHLQLLS